MSSAGRVANSSGCVVRPKAREIGLIGFAAQMPNSASMPRIMLTICVRCLTSRSHVRCIDSAACCSGDFLGSLSAARTRSKSSLPCSQKANRRRFRWNQTGSCALEKRPEGGGHQ